MLPEKYHYLLAHRSKKILKNKGEELLDLCKQEFNNYLNLNTESALDFDHLRLLASKIKDFADKIAITPDEVNNLSSAEQADINHFINQISAKLDVFSQENFTFERGHSYYLLNRIDEVQLYQSILANFYVCWLYVPPLVADSIELTQIPVPCFYIQVTSKKPEYEYDWVKIRWMLCKDKKEPFPIPEQGKPPEEWNGEELALGYLQYAQWISHFYMPFAMKTSDTDIMNIVMHLPGNIVEPFDIQNRRSIREKLKKNFPFRSFNTIYVDRRIRIEDILAQLSLISLRQGSCTGEASTYLSYYTKKNLKARDREDYANLALQVAFKSWLFPISRSSLKEYLKKTARREIAKDTNRSKKEAAIPEGGRQTKKEKISQMLDPYEVADEVGVDPKTIYRWVENRKAFPKNQDPVLFDWEEVKRLKNEKEESDKRKLLIKLLAKKENISYGGASKRVNRRLKQGLSLREIAEEHNIYP